MTIPLVLGPGRERRADHDVIVGMVDHGAKVLDIGCGDGALMARLVRDRGAKARGLELSQAGVNACVTRGLTVVQGDADADLAGYPDGAFDVAILSKTIQSVRRPAQVLGQMMRISGRIIVSFPNFGHWRARFAYLGSGRMPVTDVLPASWHESDCVHPCTIRDFVALARHQGLYIERAVPISRGQPGAPFARTIWRANWLAEEAVFLLGRG
jgi:methionine biosynthesis protein MetW